jgi:hypothetical protein
MSDSAIPAAPYEVAARFATEDEARDAVETLILRGLGAMAAPGRGGEPGFEVLVVPGETGHAAEILGLPVDETPAPRRGGRRQFLSVLAIFGVAIVVLPVVAFFVSFKLSGG